METEHGIQCIWERRKKDFAVSVWREFMSMPYQIRGMGKDTKGKKIFLVLGQDRHSGPEACLVALSRDAYWHK